MLEKLPAEYDSRVKSMEVDEKPTEEYTDIGGLDKQIEDLNARLSESNAALVAAQQTAQAAQALHAGTIQQQLTSGTDQSEGSGDEPKKQGWFSRLFRG